MTTRWEEEAPRLARLARLPLEEGEARALAHACEAIASEFQELAAFAARLPDAPASAEGGLREDVAVDAPPEEVAGILAAAPRVDPVSRAVLVPRGGA